MSAGIHGVCQPSSASMACSARRFGRWAARELARSRSCGELGRAITPTTAAVEVRRSSRSSSGAVGSQRCTTGEFRLREELPHARVR